MKIEWKINYHPSYGFILPFLDGFHNYNESSFFDITFWHYVSHLYRHTTDWIRILSFSRYLLSNKICYWQIRRIYTTGIFSSVLDILPIQTLYAGYTCDLWWFVNKYEFRSKIVNWKIQFTIKGKIYLKKRKFPNFTNKNARKSYSAVISIDIIHSVVITESALP